MMRGDHRGRGWFLLPGAMLATALLACAGCAAGISGKATATPIPVETAAGVEHQAITNLSEAGVLHYDGTLTNSDNDQLSLDLLVTSTGEATGTVTLDSQQAQLADLGGRLFLDAGQAFWTAIADLPAGSTSAAAGNWVTVPTDILGVDPSTMLTPVAVANLLGKAFGSTDTTPLATLPTTADNGIELTGSGSSMFVDPSAPHGIRHFETSLADNARLTVDVTDASATETAVYQTLTQQAGQLQTAVDPDLDIQEGNQSWGTCDASSCSVVVTFTNSSSVSTKVLVTGNWTGDDNPVGNCQVITDPVAPGAVGNATCTVSSPQWSAFYHRAQTVPGSHPYQLAWAALALAEPPNQQTISTEATEAATPASKTANDGDTTTGRDYVYLISYQDSGSHPQVWKYGVTNVGSWQNYADDQVASCLAENRTSCSVSLVTAAGNRLSADALAKQLVATATANDGKHCPPGQWTYC
ncbi:MAG TPA: hypothetical protein VHX38_34065 [Pseudonocardiaceae bacterium]|jgi:hypothetical protein|nr:hypothetical protein [Pseudonocardiaceae bacterium]